tara:strand:- start:14810 stop:15523 length:714 start_codon:yes stop_codon:yes gene_type:complete
MFAGHKLRRSRKTIEDVSYITQAQVAGPLTVVTHTGISIGVAATHRYVVCCETNLSQPTLGLAVVSATIGGVSATILATHDAANGSNALVTWYMAKVPTGATANIVITFNRDTSGVGSQIFVYTVTPSSNSSTIDLFDSLSESITTTGDTTVLSTPSITTVEGGVVLCGALQRNGLAGSFTGGVSTTDYSADILTADWATIGHVLTTGADIDCEVTTTDTGLLTQEFKGVAISLRAI